MVEQQPVAELSHGRSGGPRPGCSGPCKRRSGPGGSGRYPNRSPRRSSRRARLYFNTEFARSADPIAFARWGRGVSFHDFVLALEIPAALLPVQGSMHEYLGLPRWHLHTRDGRYLRFIRHLAPDVPKGFFSSYLDIALKETRPI